MKRVRRIKVFPSLKGASDQATWPQGITQEVLKWSP